MEAEVRSCAERPSYLDPTHLVRPSKPLNSLQSLIFRFHLKLHALDLIEQPCCPPSPSPSKHQHHLSLHLILTIHSVFQLCILLFPPPICLFHQIVGVSEKIEFIRLIERLFDFLNHLAEVESKVRERERESVSRMEGKGSERGSILLTEYLLVLDLT